MSLTKRCLETQEKSPTEKLERARTRLNLAMREVSATEGRLLDFETAEGLQRTLLRGCARVGRVDDLNLNHGKEDTLMTTRKGSTKKRGTVGTDSTGTLAAHVAAILNNPATPVTLYNAIAEELCDMSSEIDYNTPEMIARSIAAYERREEKRQKGGAR
jgi:hypothetical protein